MPFGDKEIVCKSRATAIAVTPVWVKSECLSLGESIKVSWASGESEDGYGRGILFLHPRRVLLFYPFEKRKDFFNL